MPLSDAIVDHAQRFQTSFTSASRAGGPLLRSLDRDLLRARRADDVVMSAAVFSAVQFREGLIAIQPVTPESVPDQALEDAFADWADESLAIAEENFDGIADFWPRD